MHVTVAWFGFELDFYLGETRVDDEPEPDPRGDVLCQPIGFAPTPHPGWERPLNHWDEPSEGDEDV